MLRNIPRALVVLGLLVLAPASALASGVSVRFDLRSPATAPFPTDRFTVIDFRQQTLRRINLPKPDCTARPTDCEDIDVINTLDGFNLQPRISIPFTGAIDPATVTRAPVVLVSLGRIGPGSSTFGKVVGINQVVWNPANNTANAESDEFLDERTVYALIVTDGIRDTSGRRVQSGQFGRFRLGALTNGSIDHAYRAALLSGIARVERERRDRIIAATIFTTQSATAVLAKIANQIKGRIPEPATFALGPGGSNTSFPVATVANIVWSQQRSTALPLTPVPVTAFAALQLIPGVGTIAFGKYTSPDYLTAGRFIPPVPTRTGTPIAQSQNEVYFNLFLPAGPRPPGGWPVAIFGHGFGDSKNNSSFAVASSMAASGIATIAINVVGHGRGALSTLTVNRALANGGPVTFPAGGRGIDQNGDTAIDTTEGSSASPPQSIISNRDGLRQTVVDLMQLTRVIETGGIPDLDPLRVYYFGQSFGGIYGTIFMSVEPGVRLGVLNVPGGPIVDITWMSPTFRPALGQALHFRVPALDNLPPTTIPTTPPITIFNFAENLPLRDQPPVVNSVPGADAIQAFIEHAEWVSQSGNSVAYAPHIRKDPLHGVPAKSVILQVAKGDQTVPNPTATAIIRAGELEDRTTYYRHDLAFALNPALPRNPHGFLTSIAGASAGIALAGQRQISTFFASEVMPGIAPIVIDPDLLGLFPIEVFEVPIVLPLPETLNFIP
jgi:hypothetical protein